MMERADHDPARRQFGPDARPPGPPEDRRRRAYTLMEVIVVMTIMGVLMAIPVPLLARAVEQSRLDLAAANLRSIWAAQRYFYLENGRFGTLGELAVDTDTQDGLIDPSLASAGTFYRYTVAVSPDGGSFIAAATHPETPRCSGEIHIDDAGALGGDVLYAGRALTLSLESVK